jgi:hypothetical protein
MIIFFRIFRNRTRFFEKFRKNIFSKNFEFFSKKTTSRCRPVCFTCLFPLSHKSLQEDGDPPVDGFPPPPDSPGSAPLQYKGPSWNLASRGLFWPFRPFWPRPPKLSCVTGRWLLLVKWPSSLCHWVSLRLTSQ